MLSGPLEVTIFIWLLNDNKFSESDWLHTHGISDDLPQIDHMRSRVLALFRSPFSIRPVAARGFLLLLQANIISFIFSLQGVSNWLQLLLHVRHLMAVLCW